MTSNIPTLSGIIMPVIAFFVLSRGSIKKIRAYLKSKKEISENIKQAEMTLIGLDERLDSLKRKGNYL